MPHTIRANANASGTYELLVDWTPPHDWEGSHGRAAIRHKGVGVFESEDLANRAVVRMSLIWRSHWNGILGKCQQVAFVPGVEGEPKMERRHCYWCNDNRSKYWGQAGLNKSIGTGAHTLWEPHEVRRLCDAAIELSRGL
jgi:hypothetical protein